LKFLRRSLGFELAVVAAGFVAAVSARAQSTEELLAQRRLEYISAVDSHRSALSALRVVEQRFSTVIAERGRARREGDAAALDRALPQAQELSVPKADRQRRVSEAADVVAARRRAVIEILIVRQSELVARIDAARSSAERAQLGILLTDASNELTEFEREAEGPAALPVVMPDINFDPRDGPADLLGKAELVERHAAVTDTLIQENDAAILFLEERLRNERSRQGALANMDRFGDRIVPTCPPRVDPTVQRSDSTDAGGRPVTLSQRLAAKREYRLFLVEYRDSLLIKTEQFQLRVRRRS
jgi:hypothetical protein